MRQRTVRTPPNRYKTQLRTRGIRRLINHALLRTTLRRTDLEGPHPVNWRAGWQRQKARLAQAGRSLRHAWRWFINTDPAAAPAPERPAVPVTGTASSAAGRFTEGHFGSTTVRRYMLYEPASRGARLAPMLVLLHGCQQGAQDFAAGTRMNEAAEAAGVVVLYPEQSRAANLLRCWNWYALQDRSHRGGDAALIAALTRHVTLAQRIDPRRVYVAGMSAGGGMAAVLARDYPELYAALGVHSGMPAGLAHDLTSAMRLMSAGPTPAAGTDAELPRGVPAPLASIVFHGDEDTVVHPANGQAIHALPGAAERPPPAGSRQATTSASEGQRSVTRSVDYGAGGVTRHELWIVHGAGHAWAGGSESERHTDAQGPDASREMLRFFLQHQLAG